MTLKFPRCKAVAKDTSKERGRFLRRHPAQPEAKCVERQPEYRS